MQLLFSFHQDMRVEKTLIQTLACQLSRTLMQLLSAFDQDMRVEKTLVQTLSCHNSHNTHRRLIWAFKFLLDIITVCSMRLQMEMLLTEQVSDVTHSSSSFWPGESNVDAGELIFLLPPKTKISLLYQNHVQNISKRERCSATSTLSLELS